jgi:hypothetical protein
MTKNGERQRRDTLSEHVTLNIARKICPSRDFVPHLRCSVSFLPLTHGVAVG